MMFFIVSAAVMVFLITFRLIELAVGRNIVPQRFRDAVDRKFKKTLRVSSKIAKLSRQKIYFELRKVPVMLLHLLINLWASALRITLKMVSLVQGRGDGKVKGPVSEHLKATEALKEHLK